MTALGNLLGMSAAQIPPPPSVVPWLGSGPRGISAGDPSLQTAFWRDCGADDPAHQALRGMLFNVSGSVERDRGIAGMMPDDMPLGDAGPPSADEARQADRSPDAQSGVEDESSVWTRVLGGVQMIGGGLEVAAGALGVAVPDPLTTAAGSIAIVHGSDTAVAGAMMLVTGREVRTVTAQSVEAVADGLGADPESAELIGDVTDIGIGVLVPGGLVGRVDDALVIGARTDDVSRAAAALDNVPTAAQGTLRGVRYELPGWTTRTIDYVRRPRDEYDTLRDSFNASGRDAFLRDLAANHQDALTAAGLTDADIARIADGLVPDGWQVHHILPLDDGGTNDFANLVLIRNETEHRILTNIQRSVTRGLPVEEGRQVEFPVPDQPMLVYPGRPGEGAVPLTE